MLAAWHCAYLAHQTAGRPCLKVNQAGDCFKGGQPYCMVPNLCGVKFS